MSDGTDPATESTEAVRERTRRSLRIALMSAADLTQENRDALERIVSPALCAWTVALQQERLDGGHPRQAIAATLLLVDNVLLETLSMLVLTEHQETMRATLLQQIDQMTKEGLRVRQQRDR